MTAPDFPRPLPRSGVVGVLGIALSELAMLLRIEPAWSWHTPIAWTGFILFADAYVWSRRGSSWLRNHPAEFAFLSLASIPLWLVFEWFNLSIENWYYVNLPENFLLRMFGYAWAFATIWPALFEAGDLVSVLRDDPARAPARDAPAVRRPLGPGSIAAILAGAGLLIWPIVRPSPYLAAPVWLGFILLLDPLNARAGAESLVGDRGRGARLVNLALGGLLCGFLWEFWNYWARAKWIYTVPIMPDVKIFEMPLPGYLGFPAFALEAFTMYVALRTLVWRGPTRAISI